MAQQFTIEQVIEFADSMTSKGFYNVNSNRKRKSALNNITSVLGEEEKRPQHILDNLDDIINRWAVSASATANTINTTKSFVKGLLTDFLKYQEDPKSFKPRTRKSRKSTGKTTETKSSTKKETDVKPGGKKGKGIDPPKTGGISKDLSFNINIQIHIAADASSEQIETIFESMAKNLGLNESDK